MEIVKKCAHNTHFDCKEGDGLIWKAAPMAGIWLAHTNEMKMSREASKMPPEKNRQKNMTTNRTINLHKAPQRIEHDIRTYVLQ